MWIFFRWCLKVVCNVLTVDQSAPKTCENFSVMSNVDTFYSRPQNIQGCAVSDEPSSATGRSVIALSYLQHQLHCSTFDRCLVWILQKLFFFKWLWYQIAQNFATQLKMMSMKWSFGSYFVKDHVDIFVDILRESHLNKNECAYKLRVLSCLV